MAKTRSMTTLGDHTEHLDLVRFRNDGDDFHVLWTARRAVRMIAPTSRLRAVAVEGISVNDRLKGKRIGAGLLVADTVEYYGSESFGTAERVVVNQLKYSTQNVDTPWPWSGLSDTIIGFAARFAANAKEYGIRHAIAVGRYRFVTNRPISPNVLDAIDAVIRGGSDSLKGTAKNVSRDLQSKLGLKDFRLRQFLGTLELRGNQASRHDQQASLAAEMARIQPGTTDSSIARLKELIRTLGTSSATADPVLRIETVLRTFDVEDPAHLLPAPTHFETIGQAVARDQDAALLDAIRQAPGPFLVTASGGIGKSITTQRIASLMPAGSEVVTFDGFAGGGYRARSEARHRHDVGLIQIANELATRGLCDVLLPSAAPPHVLLRSFRSRLIQAAAIVRARSPDALVVIVLDAADNSMFAAGLQHDRCFVADLMAEQAPEGCRIVGFARPNRVADLQHPGQGPPFELAPFTLAETRAHIALHTRPEPRTAVEAFHHLTFGNPRVQANQLAAATSLTNAVERLGPGGLTVHDLIELQLAEGLEVVKALQPEADIEGLCASMAALPPLIPIDVLAQVAGVDASAILSFAADFAGGRPILLSKDAIQFRDEPVEDWFTARFMPSREQASQFADRIARISERSSYAALAMPQLLEQAGRHAELTALALGDGDDFAADPVERRLIILHRVRFALKSAFARNAFEDVAKLLIRAGEETAASERQATFLAENCDLVALLAGPATVDDFVFRRRAGGAWFGSGNAYSAAMLSTMPEREVDARTYLGLAERWLNEWVRSDQENKQNESLEVEDMAAMAFVIAMLDPPFRLSDFIRRAQWVSFRFSIASRTFERLLDAGKVEVVDIVFERSPDLFIRLAANAALRSRLLPINRKAVARTGAELVEADLPQDIASYEMGELRAALISMAEACASVGLASEAKAIVGRTSWSVSSHPFPDVQGSIPAAVSVYALVTVLDCSEPDYDELWRRYGSPTKDREAPSAEFRAILDRLLPIFVLRARSLIGPIDDVEQRIKDATANRGAIAFPQYDERGLRGSRFFAELDILHNTNALDKAALDRAEKRLNAGQYGPYPYEARHVMRLLAKFPAMHGEALRLASSVAKLIEVEHEDASSKAQSYADLARSLYPISKPEASAYFAIGVETADRVGQEMHDRLALLNGLSRQAGSDGGASAEDACRLFRIAEVYETINNHKFPWHSVFRAAQSLSVPAAVAAVSRLDSRGAEYLSGSLPDVAELLLDDGLIDLPTIASLHVLGGVWDFKNLGDHLAPISNDRREIYAVLAQDVIDGRQSSWHMSALIAAGRRHGLTTPYLEAIYESRKKQEEGRSSSSGFRPMPEVEAPVDMDGLLQGLDLTDVADVDEAFRRWRETPGRSSLEEWSKHMRAAVPVDGWPDHVLALAGCTVLDIPDVVNTLGGVSDGWPHSRAVRMSLAKAVGRIVSERAVELAGATYWWKDHLPRLAEIGGTSVAALVKLIAQKAGPHIVDFSSDGLFALARRFSQEVFDPVESRTVLRFALDRFERILKPEDGDGEYGPDLSGGETVAGAIAGLIWAQLGNPDKEDRWRATHCVRRLARFGQTGLIREIVEICRHGRADGFQTRGFPFYLHFARLHLLIAFARAATESPNSVAEFSQFLSEYATRNHLHVFERYYAGRALKGLVEHDLYEADVAIVDRWDQLLELATRSDGGVYSETDPTADEQVDAGPYYMPHEIGKDWGKPLGRAFGFEEGAFNRAVDAAIRQYVTREPNRRWDDDPRSKYPVYRRYQGTRLTPDKLSDYEADSGLAFLLGELLDSVPIDDDYDRETLADLLAERLPARPDGQWVSDRRDPTPVSTRKWLFEGGYVRDWRWGIKSDDFSALLRSGEGHIHLAGSWVETDHYKVETIEIESALVRPNAAWDILRACQFGREASFFRLPEDHWDRRSAGLFSLTSTVARPDRIYGIDDDDPLAGQISFPGYVPSKVLRRMFGFVPDDQFRRWSGKGAGAGLHMRSTVWGEPRLLRDDDKPIEGRTLTMDPAALATMLTTLRRSLIVGVRIYRRDSYIPDGETSYADPYARYFVLDGDGTIGWFRGYRPAWSRFDEAVGEV
jgi:hypothetical protein